MKRFLAVFLMITMIFSITSCSAIERFLYGDIEEEEEEYIPPKRETKDVSTDTDAVTEEPENDPRTRYDGSLGSAGTLEGRTVIISIFANDTNTMWVNNADDAKTRGEILNSLKLACDWITAQSAAYGKTVEFICDWEKYPESMEQSQIAYNIAFNTNMLTDDTASYNVISKALTTGLNIAKIQRDYDAEDVVFMFFYNTDFSNPVRPRSLSHINGDVFNLEFATVPAKFEWSKTATAGFLAQEILHIFGAYDLWQASEEGGIPQNYVDQCYFANANDILYSREEGDAITSVISPITAYYTGLVDECEDVTLYDLPVAERFLDK